jgi:hypothetical protein
MLLVFIGLGLPDHSELIPLTWNQLSSLLCRIFGGEPNHFAQNML